MICCYRKCSRRNELEWKYNSSYYIEYYFFTSYDGHIRLQFVILYNTHIVFLYTVNTVVFIMRTRDTPEIFVNGLNKSEETWYALVCALLADTIVGRYQLGTLLEVKSMNYICILYIYDVYTLFFKHNSRVPR